MKFALALVLFAASAFAGEGVNKDLAALVDSWKSAMLKGDAAALDRMYHKDLTYEHSSGKTETKTEAIAAATKAGSFAKAIEFSDLSTRVYGNTAIVKAKGNFTNAEGTTNHLDVLMVWLKSPQGWQMVARQSTKLP